MIKKIILIIGAVVFSMLLVFFTMQNNKRNKGIIYCNGVLNVNLKSGVSKGHILIELRNDKTGFIIYRGSYFNGNKKIDFNRKVFFSYTNLDSSYILKSEGIVDLGETLMGDIDDVHYDLLPAIYKEKGEIYPVDVRKMSENGFFLYDSLRLTYCSI